MTALKAFITTPNVHQQNTAILTEVTPKTCPQEEITPKNCHDTSKSLPNANVRKLGNYFLIPPSTENNLIYLSRN